MNDSKIQTVKSVVPLLGRAGRFQQAKILQYFAQVREVANIFPTPDRNVLEGGWLSNWAPETYEGCDDDKTFFGQSHCERLWRIGTSAQVAYREGRGPYAPMTPTQIDGVYNDRIENFDDAITGGHGYFRIFYELNTSTGRDSFYLDVGERVEVYAYQVNATVVGPPSSVLVTEANDAESATPLSLDGLVVDARIGAQLIPIESPTGLREARYTQLVPVPQGTAVDITIPRFARSLHVYQDALGPSSGAWGRWVGPPTACNIGTLSFDGRASRERDAAIGRESTFRTDTNPLNDRLFQLEWTIRP